jgi:DNA polymerase III subunit delta'
MPPIEYSSEWPVIGHEWAIKQLASSLNHDRVRHAYLITGPASIGKTTFARAFAQAVNCLNEELRPCGVCRSCSLIDHDNYADVRVIQSAGNTLKIDQVRDMQRMLSLRPVEARYRVVILRRFNEASPQAMDALLKTLEEPAPYVLLLLTADTTDTLLATIRSRCQPINLRALPTATVKHALEDKFHVESEHAALLAQLAVGRMGWAIRAMTDEALLTQRSELLELLEQSLGESRIGRFGLAETLSKDKDTLGVALDLWQSYWRDVMLTIHSTTTPITNRDRRHAIQQIAVGVTVDDVQRVLSALKRTAQYVEENVNTRLALEVLMLDLPRLKLLAAPPH